MTNLAALRALLGLSTVLLTLPAACASEAPVGTTRETPSASVAAIEPAHAHTEQGCGDHETEEAPGVRAAAARRVEWRHRHHKPERTVELKVLGFNDFHGQLSQGRSVSGRPAGGAAVLAAYLRAAARGFETRSLIIHAGDHVGASPPASALLQDEPSIGFLNLLGNEHCSYRHREHVRCNLVGTLGNHEFDDGRDEMLRLIHGGNHANGPFLEGRYRGARFPYVSANVVEAESERPILPAYVVKNLAGVKVGVIGAVLKETPTIVTPTGVAGLSFLDEATAINRYVDKLRRQGVRTIIVSIHQGGPQTSYAGPTQPGGAVTGVINDIVRNLDDEVDLVVSGHAHSFTNVLLPNQNGTPILVTQAFSASTAYADIALSVDRRSGDVTAKSAEIVTTYSDVAPGNAPAEDVAELVARAEALTAPLV
ncbi:MAG TPA: metallophosphoesterase, partial [Polyangiaceae bacterium]